MSQESESEPKAQTTLTVSYVTYWRHCLADTQGQSPELRSLDVVQCAKEHLRECKLPPEIAAELFALAAKTRRKPAGPHGKSDPDRIAVMVAPTRVRIGVEHDARRRAQTVGRETHAPVWIAGMLDRDGRLEAHPEELPFIGRQYLTPNGNAMIQVGSLAQADDFRSRNEGPEDPTDWAACYAYAQDLYRAVQHGDPGGVRVEDESLAWIGPVVALHQPRNTAAKHLLQAYDLLRKPVQPPSPLLARLVGEPGDTPALDDVIEQATVKHVGHMSGEYGLQPSQRRALAATIALESGQILAINGPPGTGKTSLIQTVVATLWVERALASSDPPLIHACSSNNQAILSILETLARGDAPSAKSKVPTWGARWIEGVRGYGLQMPSSAQRNGPSDPPFAQAFKGYPAWTGLPGRLHNVSWLRAQTRNFVEAATRMLGAQDRLALHEAIEDIHVRLTETHARLQKVRTQHAAVLGLRRQCDQPNHRALVADHEARLTALRADEARLRDLKNEVEAALRSVPFWEDLLAFLPPVRMRRNDRVLAPRRSYGGAGQAFEIPVELPGSDYRDTLRAAVDSQLARVQTSIAEIESSLKQAQALARSIAEIAATFDPGIGAPIANDAEGALDDVEEFEAFLDRTIRRRLYQITGRYYEGRFLQSTLESLRKDPRLASRRSRNACLAQFHRFAMLMPLSASTLFMVPRLFDCFDAKTGESPPLDRAIDLLVMDEAGQATPEVGAVAFHYAKRAVVVGDPHQIEPIWGISRVIDAANQSLAGIELAVPGGDAMESSRGSVMRMAQRVSRFSESDGGGLMLREHWRCIPRIIQYCNDLVYGCLEAKRPPPDEKPLLPAFAWGHVDSRAVRRGSSWANPGEAMAIAEWIDRRRADFETHYAGLGNVGVISPFKAQATEIKRALAALGLHGALEPQVDVGTVHTFQGAEKKLMIFSPTYDVESDGGYFFDRGTNMMNVAVSRAKDAFVVIGNMSLFRTTEDAVSARQPSRLLADALFENPAEQEILDVWPASPELFAEGRFEALPSLDAHRTYLQEAFRQAQSELLIVSPQLTVAAIAADSVLDKVRSARERDVEVVIVFSRDLQSDRETPNLTKALREAGAEVLALDRIHSKLLVTDRRRIACGSFNWLSASRDRESRFARWEMSVVCPASEPDAARMIEKTIERVEAGRALIAAES